MMEITCPHCKRQVDILDPAKELKDLGEELVTTCEHCSRPFKTDWITYQDCIPVA